MLEYEVLSVPVPIYSVNRLKSKWIHVYNPITSIEGVEIKMNLQKPSVDIRISKSRKNGQLILRRCEIFIKAIVVGIAPEKCKDLLEVEADIINFMISDIKRLSPNSATRAVARIIGKEGKTKDLIESTSGAKLFIKDEHMVYIVGTDKAIKIAKDAVCRLVMGAQPGAIHNNLKRLVAKNKKEYFETVYYQED